MDLFYLKGSQIMPNFDPESKFVCMYVYKSDIACPIEALEYYGRFKKVLHVIIS